MKKVVVYVVDGVVSKVLTEEPMDVIILDDFVEGLEEDCLHTIMGEQVQVFEDISIVHPGNIRTIVSQIKKTEAIPQIKQRSCKVCGDLLLEDKDVGLVNSFGGITCQKQVCREKVREEFFSRIDD